MFKIFKNIILFSESEQPQEVETDQLQLATGMLLLEMAQADGTIQPEEEKRIHTIIRQRFSLSEADSKALIEQARTAQAENLDLYPVTSLVNRHCSNEEKCLLLENVWEIVYADGVLDQHEDYLMHKLGTMMHLSHRQLIDAKLRAKEKMDAERQGS
jgi:uncharacterized tellurite resistance protein B-like protein